MFCYEKKENFDFFVTREHEYFSLTWSYRNSADSDTLLALKTKGRLVSSKKFSPEENKHICGIERVKVPPLTS